MTRILDALDAGATGYLLKDAEPAELLARRARRGARRVAAGPRAPRVTVLRARTERRWPASSPSASSRSSRWSAPGLPNKLIARRLDISEKTVKNHLTSIFRALDVDDRTQAALWAQRHGIVDRGT